MNTWVQIWTVCVHRWILEQTLIRPLSLNFQLIYALGIGRIDYIDFKKIYNGLFIEKIFCFREFWFLPLNHCLRKKVDSYRRWISIFFGRFFLALRVLRMSKSEIINLLLKLWIKNGFLSGKVLFLVLIFMDDRGHFSNIFLKPLIFTTIS